MTYICINTTISNTLTKKKNKGFHKIEVREQFRLYDNCNNRQRRTAAMFLFSKLCSTKINYNYTRQSKVFNKRITSL